MTSDFETNRGDDGDVLGDKRTERLHVLLGYACNNNCVFCMEEDRVTRAHRILEVPPEQVRRIMEQSKGAREVMFTSGEPLLNQHFIQYVRWARELGYETIGVITNGRLFTYERVARRALAAGLNHIVVSVHGADERSHDRLTRSVSSYAQTIVGLRTLARLKHRYPFRLHTSTVVNRRNYLLLHDIWASLQGLQIDQFIFNVIQPVGRAESRFGKLVARFSDVAQSFSEFVLRLPPEERRRVFLLDVPACVTENLPPEVRGFVERYQYYEHESGLDDALRADFETGEPDDEGAPLRLLTRRRLDETRKSKRDECARCIHEPHCDGVWNRYIETHGWAEFQPVCAEENDRDEQTSASGRPVGE